MFLRPQSWSRLKPITKALLPPSRVHFMVCAPLIQDSSVRRPHSTYQKVVQGKCPLHCLRFNGVVCSNTLFSNTSAFTNSLSIRANSARKILEHLFWSNTSGFQFWGPLARTNFLSALCGLPTSSHSFPRNGAHKQVVGRAKSSIQGGRPKRQC